MKVLVAGGAGFIGSHLVDALCSLGHNAISIDDFSNGRKQNIAHLVGNSLYNSYEMDINNLEELQRIFAYEQFEYVFHLAANSDIKASANDPAVEYRNTFTTTFNILECMRLYNVKKMFFASTSAVYGEKPGLISESASDLKPISYYGACKLASESIISAYSYMNQYSSLVFRFPNVIGPRLTHGVIYDFIAKLRKNPNKLEILGDGKQSKPYMHVSDLIRGIIQFMNKPQDEVLVYNIGVETHTNVTHIADLICSEMNLKNVQYQYSGGAGGWKGDVPHFEYDLWKVHSEGWNALMTSDDAVLRTIKEILQCKQ